MNSNDMTRNYRVRNINNKFIYGDVIEICNSKYIFTDNIIEKDNDSITIKMYNCTNDIIDKSTDLFDTNFVPCFMNDIIRYEIYYDDDEYEVVTTIVDEEELNYLLYGSFTEVGFEILGNIYDNPDMYNSIIKSYNL